LPFCQVCNQFARLNQVCNHFTSCPLLLFTTFTTQTRTRNTISIYPQCYSDLHVLTDPFFLLYFIMNPRYNVSIIVLKNKNKNVMISTIKWTYPFLMKRYHSRIITFNIKCIRCHGDLIGIVILHTGSRHDSEIYILTIISTYIHNSSHIHYYILCYIPFITKCITLPLIYLINLH
jgi:hypothetical protein